LEASLALNVDIPYERIGRYLDGFGTGELLDLVHLAGLVRCRANLADHHGRELDERMRRSMREHLMRFRGADGGFNTTAGAARGTAYGGFLALGACQDLHLFDSDAEGISCSFESLHMPDGGFSNEPAMSVSAGAATAAAVTTFHYLDRPIPEAALDWLAARTHRLGGFTAIAMPADAAVPDLLSTATALHALLLAGASLDDTQQHLDYLDSLWSAEGGFRGHWGDDVLDCEYTYYGLLSLGNLAGS
jgi:prenyltransferase beta subunit